MIVQMLVSEIMDFRQKLAEHKVLWSQSLAKYVPSYPVKNTSELDEQVTELNRIYGKMTPYLRTLAGHPKMQDPATGLTWDCLDSAISRGDVAQRKGPSIRSALDYLDQVIGKLNSMDADTDLSKNHSTAKTVSDKAKKESLDMSALHPGVISLAGDLFRNGHYAEAAEASWKAIRDLMRERTGLKGDGAKLVDTTLSTSEPILVFGDLTDQSQKNLQIGMMMMLKGFHQGVRSVVSHSDHLAIDDIMAMEYMATASLLCRKLDRATNVGESE